MTKTLIALLGVALIGVSCSHGVSRIQTRSLPTQNPTTYSFPLPVEETHARALQAFSIEHQVKEPIFPRSAKADAFEDAAIRTKDMAVSEIEWRLAWPHYDDMHEHRLTGAFTLTDGIRRDFARAILFLKTDLEYEWKHQMGLRGFLNSSFHVRPLRRTYPLRTEGGDLRYWPFYRRSDYSAARETPRYLSGRRV